MNPELVIVIPTKNEEFLIGDLLLSLSEQNYVNAETPIIIADAGSTDRTLAVVKQFNQKLQVTITYGGLPGVGRNRGVAYTKETISKYILFLDADVTFINTYTIRRAVDFMNLNNLDLLAINLWVREKDIFGNILCGLHNFSQKFTSVI